MKYLLIATTLLCCTAAASAADHHETKPNNLSDKQKKDGWVLLFDGKSTKGWSGWKKEAVPDSWKVEDGTLTLKGRGGDIRTAKMYGDFELVLDYKISANGNSGIMYRSTEDHDAPYETGPEFQILDNNSTKYDDAKKETNIAGSNYALYESDREASKKAGEWNTAKIVANDGKIEHWLNGRKVVSYDIKSDEFKNRVANSKFKNWPNFAQREKGFIVLQDHGDIVSFRNVRIREIKKDDNKTSADWPKIITEKRLYAANDFRGKKAPAFAVETWLTDEPQRAGKVMLVDYWATWCGPCVRLIPEMNEFHEKFSDDLVIIGLSDEKQETVTDFMGNHEVHYAMAIDTQGRMKKALGVQGIPHVMIVDSTGIVRWQGFPGSAEDPLTAKVIQQIIDADKAQRPQLN